MKVLRKYDIEVFDFQVGDQLVIDLKGFGNFTATAHNVTDNGALFIFDNCVAEHRMNKKNTNEGGYDNSELAKWINTTLIQAFPEEIKARIMSIYIPTYGQMFGHDDWYDSTITPDEDEQLPLMKKRRNRVADFNDNYEWYWLNNSVKESVSSAGFAGVSYGCATYYSASGSSGVRPAFWLE